MRRILGFRRLLIILTIISALSLLLACYIAFYPIPWLPFLDAFGILVPPLIIINFIFLLIWLFVRRHYAFILAVPLLVGFLCFGSIYQFRSSNHSDFQKDLSIMTYNVKGFGLNSRNIDSDSVSKDILGFIEKQDPDIICFQEFSRIMARNLKQYPFQYQTPYGSNRTKQAIFSKYPIVGSGSLDFPKSTNNALFADILHGKETVRIYNIHLQSYFIYSFRSQIIRNAGLGLLKRIWRTTSKHREQVEILNAHRSASPHPVVFCGDFNQPSYSPSFQSLLEGMKDTFKERGQGWGTTFKRNIISARIDFILTDEQAFEVLEHRNYDLRLSDHLPIMARLKYTSD